MKNMCWDGVEARTSGSSGNVGELKNENWNSPCCEKATKFKISSAFSSPLDKENILLGNKI